MTAESWGIYVAIVIIVLVMLEVRALATKTPTLSQTVWTATRRWPLLPFVLGVVVGALAVHWFGVGWCPA